MTDVLILKETDFMISIKGLDVLRKTKRRASRYGKN